MDKRWLPVKVLKKLLPRRVVRPFLPYWHWSRGVIANGINGYPARNLKVIAVTGTNGKTTTANYIASILIAAGYKVGISTTALFRIGDKVWDNTLNMTNENPFAVYKLFKRYKKAKVDWVVLEWTAIGEHQKRITGIPVDTAVMTNLTHDHLDYFRTMQKYAAAKAKLFKRAKRNAVLNRDDEWFDYFRHASHRKTLFTYGAKRNADVRVHKANLKAHGSKVLVKLGSEELVWNLKLIGKFNVYNAMAAAAATMALAVDPQHITAGLEALDSVPGRMEAIDHGQPFAVIVDYAHAPDAMENVLETLRPLTKSRLIAVFGSMGDRDRTKRPVMGQIASQLCDVAIITDEEWYTENPDEVRQQVLQGAQHSHGKAEVHETADRREAIKQAFRLAKLGDTVVILGLGHQKYRVMDGKKEAWDDRDVAREVLKELHFSK